MNVNRSHQHIKKVFFLFILFCLLALNLGLNASAKAQAALPSSLDNLAAKAILQVISQEAKLTASDGTFDDSFGYSVDISGDTVVVGAIGDDGSSGSEQGSVYVFVKPAGGWQTTSTCTAKLTPSEGEFHQY